MQTRFYRHYKNKPYKFLGLARHSETLEELVLYEAMYENEIGRTWVRPKEMFFEKIQKNNRQVYRFEPINFRFENTDTCSEKEIASIKEISQQVLTSFDESGLINRIQSHAPFFLQIAFENQKPVGFKLGYALNKQIFYSWIEAVLPEYRGLGIGSALMENQHDWCRRNHFDKIQTKSENEDKQMISLNLNFGFEIVGTENNPLNKIKILFEKSLS